MHRRTRPGPGGMHAGSNQQRVELNGTHMGSAMHGGKNPVQTRLSPHDAHKSIRPPLRSEGLFHAKEFPIGMVQAAMPHQHQSLIRPGRLQRIQQGPGKCRAVLRSIQQRRPHSQGKSVCGKWRGLRFELVKLFPWSQEKRLDENVAVPLHSELVQGLLDIRHIHAPRNAAEYLSGRGPAQSKPRQGIGKLALNGRNTGLPGIGKPGPE